MTPKDRVELEKLQAALRHDAADVRSRLKLADLFVRAGQLDDAAAEYFRVATHYQENGFYLKATAVCRQILKSHPLHGPAYRVLSELYSALGLVSDAIAILQTFVEIHVRPLARDGQSSQARDRIQSLGALDACHYDAQLVVLAMQVEIDPDDSSTLRRLAAALIASGQPRVAASAAERALRGNPDDFEALETLALAFVELGEVAKARAALESLVAVCERVGNKPRLEEARERLRQLAMLP